MSEAARLALAVAAVAAWLGHVGWIAWRGRARALPLPGDGEATLVAFASQTGFAERIAEATAAALRAGGGTVAMAPLGEIDAALLARTRMALFIATTTGEGDPPDDAARFVARMMGEPQALQGTRFAVLGLGDRNYRHFCHFGHRLDRWLADSGATREADLIEVDNGEAGALRHWQQNLRQFGAATDMPDWAPPAYVAGRLASRAHLNPGSPGGATFHIGIAPDEALAWTAGDIAEIYPGPAADALAGEPSLPHRDYSIASLPGDGAIELVVRRMETPDGKAGLGSGWLTEGLAEGAAVALRVRRNPSFHPPAPDAPMILIGSGTGIAGLRAHLKARPAETRNWLLFGERSAAADALFAAELEAWAESGHLDRLDLCFSRDGGGYVQDRLDRCADAVRAWLDDGAAIYVCGSMTRMAAGVDASLAAAIGRSALEDLGACGRYRRDIY